MSKSLILRLLSKVSRNENDSNFVEVALGALVSFLLKVVGAAAAFAFNVLLARVVGLEGSGIFFLALTIVTVVGVLSRAGLDNTVVRFTAAHSSGGDWAAVNGVYARSMGIVLVTSTVATAALYLAAPWLAVSAFSKPEAATVIRWMSLSILPTAVFSLHAEMLKGLKRVGLTIFVQNILPWTLCALGLLMMGGGTGAAGAAAAYLFSAVLTAAAGVVLWRRLGAVLGFSLVKGRFSASKIFASCVPLFWASAMNLVINWASFFFLSVWGTKAELGLFGTASRTALLMSFIHVAVNSIVAPKFADLYHRGDFTGLGDIARSSAGMLTVLSFPVLAVFLLFPSYVMNIFGESFMEGGTILSILAVGQFVNVATGSVGYLLIMSGNERAYRNNVSIAAALSVLLNLVLTPMYGLKGAAIATSLSIAFQNITASYLVYNITNIRILPLPGLLIGKKRYRS